MWSDWLVFCDYGFSVSALWCPLATPTILIGFLLPWTWGISSRLLQQSTAAAPYLGRVVSPHHRPSWPWTWSSSSRSSCVLYVCCSIQNLSFFFWLTSLCITGSRFIHFLEVTHMCSFLWLSNIPLCICITTSLSIHLLDIYVSSML